MRKVAASELTTAIDLLMYWMKAQATRWTGGLAGPVSHSAWERLV